MNVLTLPKHVYSHDILINITYRLTVTQNFNLFIVIFHDDFRVESHLFEIVSLSFSLRAKCTISGKITFMFR